MFRECRHCTWLLVLSQSIAGICHVVRIIFADHWKEHRYSVATLLGQVLIIWVYVPDTKQDIVIQKFQKLSMILWQSKNKYPFSYLSWTNLIIYQGIYLSIISIICDLSTYLWASEWSKNRACVEIHCLGPKLFLKNTLAWVPSFIPTSFVSLEASSFWTQETFLSSKVSESSSHTIYLLCISPFCSLQFLRTRHEFLAVREFASLWGRQRSRKQIPNCTHHMCTSIHSHIRTSI